MLCKTQNHKDFPALGALPDLGVRASFDPHASSSLPRLGRCRRAFSEEAAAMIRKKTATAARDPGADPAFPTREAFCRRGDRGLSGETVADLAQGEALAAELLDLLDPLEDVLVVEPMARGGPLGFSDEAEHRVVVEGLTSEPGVTDQLADLVELLRRRHERVGWDGFGCFCVNGSSLSELEGNREANAGRSRCSR